MEKRILIIDDDVDFTDLLKANLKETGKYKVRMENHGFRSFHAAKAFRPDLICSVPSTAKVKPHEQSPSSSRHSLAPQLLSSNIILQAVLLPTQLPPTLRLSMIR